ncbi:DNA/RNA helicase domain-containing protein [Promicromonospora kroppenstedtii]|uniref:DNA/RNA helicase domain-containing protein n=1 Tax=Promicromonospora kroppenstedtii TaxID=440482 RepID=A0ABW7XH45_9MICO
MRATGSLRRSPGQSPSCANPRVRQVQREARGSRCGSRRLGGATCQEPRRDVDQEDVTDDEFERLTRNTYKVQLTRGTVGTLIYSTDEETRLSLWFLVSGPLLLVT